MRRVLPDPVPTEVVQAMLDAAVRSPSGGNSQNWRFLVVTDPETRAGVGALYRDAFGVLMEEVYGKALEKARRDGDRGTLRVFSSAQWLADNAAQVPLWLFFYGRGDESGASIYPAVWSAMLAARGHGVGTCLTTILGSFRPAETDEVLGVPAGRGWKQAAAVPCGYPKGRWGVAARRPVHEVTYGDRWGSPVSWTVDEPLWGDTEG